MPFLQLLLPLNCIENMLMDFIINKFLGIVLVAKTTIDMKFVLGNPSF